MKKIDWFEVMIGEKQALSANGFRILALGGWLLSAGSEEAIIIIFKKDCTCR